MTEAKKAILEKDYLMVDSIHFNNVTYAIDRKGKGMHIIAGKSIIPIEADQVNTFTREIAEVWRSMKG